MKKQQWTGYFTALFIFSFASESTELPSKFSNNLIYLTPQLNDQTRVTFFTDTGGGWNAISKQLSDKYQWPVTDRNTENGIIQVTDMPNFDASASVPKAGLNNWWAGKMQVVPKNDLSHHNDVDGVLGGRWHAEKIIDFNYPRKSISVLSAVPDISDFSELHLGFQKNQHGQYTMAFPRIEITISGQKLPMLLDTGASAWPSDGAMQAIGLPGRQIATSFIVASIFDHWALSHPDWLTIDNACTLSKQSMIRVPEISIGAEIIGPVWFTRRPDKSFHQYMSSMMDKRIEGALGGSALQHIRLVVDYHKELAYAASALQPASSSEVDIQTLVEKINKDNVVRSDSASKWIQASPKVTHLVEEHRQHLYNRGTTVTGFDCDRDGRADDAEKCLFLYRQLVRYIEQH